MAKAIKPALLPLEEVRYLENQRADLLSQLRRNIRRAGVVSSIYKAMDKIDVKLDAHRAAINLQAAE